MKGRRRCLEAQRPEKKAVWSICPLASEAIIET